MIIMRGIGSLDWKLVGYTRCYGGGGEEAGSSPLLLLKGRNPNPVQVVVGGDGEKVVSPVLQAWTSLRTITGMSRRSSDGIIR